MGDRWHVWAGAGQAADCAGLPAPWCDLHQHVGAAVPQELVYDELPGVFVWVGGCRDVARGD